VGRAAAACSEQKSGCLESRQNRPVSLTLLSAHPTHIIPETRLKIEAEGTPDPVDSFWSFSGFYHKFADPRSEYEIVMDVMS